MVVVNQHRVVYKIVCMYLEKKTVKTRQDDKDNEEIERKRTCRSFKLIIEKKNRCMCIHVHVSWMLRNGQQNKEKKQKRR